MEMETTGSEKTLLEQEAPRKSGRPPPIVMIFTTNLIRLQSDLKEQESMSSAIHEMELVS
jgi:hypothetical protein